MAYQRGCMGKSPGRGERGPVLDVAGEGAGLELEEAADPFSVAGWPVAGGAVEAGFESLDEEAAGFELEADGATGGGLPPAIAVAEGGEEGEGDEVGEGCAELFDETEDEGGRGAGGEVEDLRLRHLMLVFGCRSFRHRPGRGLAVVVEEFGEALESAGCGGEGGGVGGAGGGGEGAEGFGEAGDDGLRGGFAEVDGAVAGLGEPGACAVEAVPEGSCEVRVEGGEELGAVEGAFEAGGEGLGEVDGPEAFGEAGREVVGLADVVGVDAVAADGGGDEDFGGDGGVDDGEGGLVLVMEAEGVGGDLGAPGGVVAEAGCQPFPEAADVVDGGGVEVFDLGVVDEPELFAGVAADDVECPGGDDGDLEGLGVPGWFCGRPECVGGAERGEVIAPGEGFVDAVAEVEAGEDVRVEAEEEGGAGCGLVGVEGLVVVGAGEE